MNYVVDTNVIVQMNRYTPRDLHPTVWQTVENHLIRPGRMVMPRDVCDELKRVEDGLAPWAKGFANFVEEPTEDDLTVVTDISTDHPDWVSGQQNSADPWVVAHAYRRGAVIVTDERAKGPNTADHNLRIPNVAAELGVECINFNELGRREGWIF